MSERFDFRDEIDSLMLCIVGEGPHLVRSKCVPVSDEIGNGSETQGASLIVSQSKVKGVQLPFRAEFDDSPIVVERLGNASCVDHQAADGGPGNRIGSGSALD